ncbi:MAG: insulinase family protein [Candidatus Krumholzibacteriota bacterium]|nr:insulinase family protein [Candidatus Krumholzibacteriota bacterium]
MRRILLAAAALLVIPAAAAAEPTRVVEHAPGAPEVIYECHPASPVFLAAVAVEAGSARETPMTRGLSHLLEHLLFDGSERFDRGEIAAWVERNGAFLNAFTRKETAVFFLLARSDLVDEGIEILSQMLLRPVFPPAELEKERGVVLEEMRQGRDDPRERRERLVSRRLYAGSPLAEPVIGLETTIETVSREQIGAYHGERYRPERMRILLMGGFDRDRARGLVEDHFCGGPREWRDGSRPARDGSAVPAPRWSGRIARIVDPGLDPGLEAMLPLPRVDEPGFPAALVAARILGSPAGPLAGCLDALGLPDPGVSLETHGAFSALRISIDGTAETAGRLEEALAVVLGRLAHWEPDVHAVAAARTAVGASEAFDRERYHYYMMLAGQPVALFGDRYLDAADEGVARVERPDVARLARRRLVDPPFNAVVVLPGASSAKGEAAAQPVKTTRARNGVLIAATSRPGSPVAALHVLVRDRAMLEREHDGARISLLHGILDHSPAGRKLAGQLERIGARIAWGDNPFISMDDYQVSPAWAFVRLEAPADNFNKAVVLLASFLLQAPVEESGVSAAASRIAVELGARTGRPFFALDRELGRALFGDHPWGTGAFPETAGELSAPAFERLMRDVYRGENLIVTAVGPRDPEETIRIVEKAFGNLPPGGGAESIRPAAVAGGAVVEETAAIEGIYLRRGWLVVDPEPGETAALRVAAEVLSRRMQEEIRETRGLAYSTGCGARLLPGAVVVSATVGSRAANLDEVSAVLDSLIRSLAEAPPTAEETAAATDRLRGRLARRLLSSVNEAADLGLRLFLYPGEPGGENVTAVDAAAVQAAIVRRLDPAGGVAVRLLPGADEPPAPRRRPPPGMPGMR